VLFVLFRFGLGVNYFPLALIAPQLAYKLFYGLLTAYLYGGGILNAVLISITRQEQDIDKWIIRFGSVAVLSIGSCLSLVLNRTLSKLPVGTIGERKTTE
jgi:hypothetical protein